MTRVCVYPSVSRVRSGMNGLRTLQDQGTDLRSRHADHSPTCGINREKLFRISPLIHDSCLLLRGCQTSSRQSIDTYRSRSRVLLLSFPSLRRSCSIRFSRTRSSARASTRSFSWRYPTASSRARSISFDTYGCISLHQRSRGRGLSTTAARIGLTNTHSASSRNLPQLYTRAIH